MQMQQLPGAASSLRGCSVRVMPLLLGDGHDENAGVYAVEYERTGIF
jgi:hypothetical protein